MNKFAFNNKNIIITGGAGFIGTNLVNVLSKYDNIKITVIDNLWRGEKKHIENFKNVKLIEEDLTNYEVCKKYIKNAEIVYHLAEIVCGVDYAFNNQSFIFRQNIIINSNVLNASIENNIKNYIYVGSACSYPKINQNRRDLNYFSEEDIHPLSPETSYGMSKYLGEYEAELAMNDNKINVGILRLHNVYGSYCSLDDKLSQVIPSLIKKVINSNGILNVWGSGNQYRDFIYVDDVVNALLLMAENGMNKGVIQIGTGEATTIVDLANILLKVSKSYSDKEIKIEFDTTKLEGDFGRLSINKKANELLKWYPNVSINDGLKKTFKWIYNQL
jgi:GDP-D-mannose 3', 5'-epimerase